MPKVIGFDASVAKVCTCKNCSAKVEYLPIDVQQEVDIDYTGSRDIWYFVQCPNCNQKIMLN